MVKSEGQSTEERSRPQRVCSRPTFPSLQLNTNQHRHGRKLPRGGKVPPEKNRWYHQESHGAQTSSYSQQTRWRDLMIGREKSIQKDITSVVGQIRPRLKTVSLSLKVGYERIKLFPSNLITFQKRCETKVTHMMLGGCTLVQPL